MSATFAKLYDPFIVDVWLCGLRHFLFALFVCS
jgi:hypothetical protein